ncbi:bifunctional 2',3'-cyclic-nucleotide 2'-phosphodiesterase/3'-nucleotidase [Jiella sp. MQZ9-1]|uniref:Bifunctional 2',3'-cyclic-nucleotide 2'-phosphodiesterase/3'-nucleotidase n=1 Tax=Jiella flava TaxID=2816857 RepID=A0A939FV37_9HYPH|nr:bifunctional 2',3'-cyclic-nucleotide 2'-phosphodiesterase/3'-nucleotidase [Jiella flava]MBO0661404.1 bifunctional 2',3'-cyclic-nucleotide 2'-phosphodiesterase/3'-nucleotidase [Jiella flava]MCD2470048.1 bifunctional 2',3'-cyclic-nucleotide 2'-phosphodiesterase/3'-nucleotidase [Jiella flava]
MSDPQRHALSRRHFLAGSAALGAAVVLHPYSVRAAANQAHLRLMETTDIHVNVYPYDYYADKPSDTVGLARTAAIIKEIRAEAKNAMLFDNGDFLQGNPMGDYVAYQRGMKDGDIHPVIAAMNVLKYEAGTLGNHEFNYGLPFLDKVMAGANFPYCCANLVKGKLAATPLEDTLYLPPYRVLDRTIELGDGTKKKIRIGVIGFVPPQIMTWDQQNLQGKVDTRGIVEAAEAWVPKLRAEGVDLVLALSHSGIAANDPNDEKPENASLQLAKVKGIDVVFTGHQHLRFPGEKDFQDIADADPKKGTLAGKPAVMAGFWGSDLGLVDLLLEHDGTGWRIADFSTELRPIYERAEKTVTPTVASDQPVLDAARKDHEATLTYVRTPVGKTSAPLFSYFALVADDPSVQIVNQAQTWYMREILKPTEFGKLPLLSAAAPFKAGGRGGPDYYTDVPAGPIAIKNVADLYLYPNTVRAVKITGADVKEWLEMSAGMFRRIEAGRSDQPLLADDFPSYNFDVIDGVTYLIDVTKPAKYTAEGKVADAGAARIRDLKFDDQPIDPKQEFIVATNNYRASGGGHFPGISEDKIVYVAPDANRDVIVRYIHQKGTINPSADANWRFAPVAKTSAVFETGPKAKDYVGQVKGVTIKPTGKEKDGFALYQITL